MCEAHNHGAAETDAAATGTAEATHDHGSHDHGSHDHGGHDHGGHQHGGHQHGATGADSENAECLVMPGSFVNKAEAEAAGLVREHEGTKYYLCCAACGPLFDADPEKYAAAAA